MFFGKGGFFYWWDKIDLYIDDVLFLVNVFFLKCFNVVNLNCVNMFVYEKICKLVSNEWEFLVVYR